MKWISFFALASVLISPNVFAAEPVTLSAPVPAISPSYAAGSFNTVIYTLRNYVPESLPVTVGGISNGITRTAVTNDCGNAMAPALSTGPSVCNIGIVINPSSSQVGSSVNQVLQIDYQGRAPLTSPISFSVNSFFAYVIPASTSPTIVQYIVDAVSGLFTLSASSPLTTYDGSSLSQSFVQLVFATVGGVQYGYGVDQAGFIYQCIIDDAANGTFSTCTATPASPPSGWGPRAIAFTSFLGVPYAYVTDVDGGEVFQCSINVGGPSNGSFSTCTAVPGASFSAPYGIAFATIGGFQYAYISDAGAGGGTPGDVYQCSFNADGSVFTACPTTPTSPPSWVPYSLTFGTTAGTRYAYVADNGTSTVGNVYQCVLNTNGTLSGCTPTPSTTPTPTSDWVPFQIAFATLQGKQYAYVAASQGSSAGGMFVCSMDGSGLFTGCNPTPDPKPSTWAPAGIAFRFD